MTAISSISSVTTTAQPPGAIDLHAGGNYHMPIPEPPIGPGGPGGPETPGPSGAEVDPNSPGPRTDNDITVQRWGIGDQVLSMQVDTGDGDDDIQLTIYSDGTSALWVNGDFKGRMTKEETAALTINTGEGNDRVTIQDQRSFQDDRLPSVNNNGTQGTDHVEVHYPGYPPAAFPLPPGERSP